MSFVPVEPGYEFVTILPPRRSAPPPPEDGVWGTLQLTLHADTHLHLGSGVPVPVSVDAVPVPVDTLAAGTASVPRRFGTHFEAVIPGSGWKGAVRAITEALTPSCDPFDQGCGADGTGLCPACTLFGIGGQRGRIGFTDASAAETEPRVLRVRQRYSHPSAPASGRRVYRTTAEQSAAAAEEYLQTIPPGTALRGELTLHGVPSWGLGLLTIVLGLGPRGLPFLRVGGGKNRGLGIVTVDRIGGAVADGLAAWMHNRRVRLDDEGVRRERLVAWQDDAVGTFPVLEERIARIREIMES